MAVIFNESMVPITTGLTSTALAVGCPPVEIGISGTAWDAEVEVEVVVTLEINDSDNGEGVVKVELKVPVEVEVWVVVEIEVRVKVEDEVVTFGWSGCGAAIVVAVVCVTTGESGVIGNNPETVGTAPGGSKMPISLLK